MKNGILLILFVVQTSFLVAQKTTIFHLDFMPTWKGERLVLEKNYYTEEDTISIEMLKFYISNIVFLNEEKTVFEEKNSFHLVNYENENTTKIVIKLPDNLNFTKVKFNIGIDSTTQVSGAMGGDLDPTNGMYWTWQSGYINFKLEGKSQRCNTRKHEFQFHLGGYSAPFNSLQTRVFDLKNKDNLTLQFDVFEFLKNIDLGKINHIMSPSLEAVEVGKWLNF